MKKGIIFIIGSLLFLVMGCKQSKVEHSNSLLNEFYKEYLALLDSAERIDFLEDEAKMSPCVGDTANRYFIKYRQKINGYTVKVSFVTDTTTSGVRGFARFYLISEKSEVLELLNSLCLADSILLRKGVINEVDYNAPTLDYGKPVCLSEFTDLPFCFLDADFDGEEELLLNYPGVAQRETSAFGMFRIGSSDRKGFLTYEADKMYYNLSEVSDELYKYCLDAFTEFDFVNKEVKFTLFGGWNSSSYIYKLNGRKPVFYKKEEYEGGKKLTD